MSIVLTRTLCPASTLAGTACAGVGTARAWLSCSDCFELADTQTEDLLVNNRLHEGFRVHLRGCPACWQETYTLRVLLAVDCGIEPAPPTTVSTLVRTRPEPNDPRTHQRTGPEPGSVSLNRRSTALCRRRAAGCDDRVAL